MPSRADLATTADSAGTRAEQRVSAPLPVVSGAPLASHQRGVLAPATLATWLPGRPGTVPVFTCRSLGEGGTRLGPCDIAVATPQHVTPASPQSRRHFGEFPASVMRETGTRRLRPRSARFEPVRL